jgi:CRP/FNR family transcriptional regulator, polysaccharide utilization system transcription regulator
MNSTILVIEDNHEMSQNIAEILRLAHYNVLIAPDGKTGVSLACSTKPDLIVCDIMMPDLDGYGVLHILNRSPETAKIPFIFLTAKADHQDFRTGMNMGADDYITKPFDGLDLLKVIEVRLRKSDYLKTGFSTVSVGTPAHVAGDTLEPKLIEKLKEGHNLRKYRKKDFIYLEGQEALGLYLVGKGEIKTFKTNKDGKELIIGMYRASDLLGVVPLLNNSPHDDTAVVQSEQSEVYFIAKNDFLNMVYTNTDVARQLIRLLAGYVADGEDRMIRLAYQSVRERVAGVLLQLENTGSPDSLITLSRKDISCLVGTATESLNRTLLDFRDEGLIEIKEHGIVVKNRQKLQKLQK